MMDKKNFNYPSKLLQIEIREQLKNLNLDEKVIETKINQVIQKVLFEKSKVELPEKYESKIIDLSIRNSVISHLDGIENRVLTSILILSGIAQDRGEINYNNLNFSVTFSFKRADLFKLMGLDRASSSKQRNMVLQALISLDNKKFIIPSSDGKIRFSRLVNLDNTDFKNSTITVTIDDTFVSISEKKSTYFELPTNINHKLKQLTTGRPNLGVELFIKCLYQAKHISKDNQVSYSYEKLIEIMRLERYKRDGRKSKIASTIDKAFLIAKKLDLVSSIQEDVTVHNTVKYIIKFK